jgi:hypothetical protein
MWCAPNDGYTILMGANSNAVNEPVQEFAVRSPTIHPVALLAEAPTVLVAPVPRRQSVQDPIAPPAQSRVRSYATAGKERRRISPVSCSASWPASAYAGALQGSGETTGDPLSGRTKSCLPIPPVLSFIQDGQLRGIARPAQPRERRPGLPTVEEAGLSDLDMRMFGPDGALGTPDDIDKLSQAAMITCGHGARRAGRWVPRCHPGTRQQFGAFIREKSTRGQGRRNFRSDRAVIRR